MSIGGPLSARSRFLRAGRNGPPPTGPSLRMLAAATAEVVTLLGPPGTTLMKKVG